jgi:hypothetical protein
MKSFFTRGAFMLPLFFSLFFIKGADLPNYFQVFYSDIDEYDKWLVSDRNDEFKDIFISLYDLPHKNKRINRYSLKTKILESYSKDVSYAYFYISVSSSTAVNMLIYGIKKGEISINGASRGEINYGESFSGHTSLSAQLEKGIYFFSFRIDESIEGVPLLILSSKKPVYSENAGFTKNASARIKTKNTAHNKTFNMFPFLYKSFCFPYLADNDAGRDLFFSVSSRKVLSAEKYNHLIFHLFYQATRDKSKDVLIKAGFSDKKINKWKKRVFEKEVCFYDFIE